MDTGGGGRGGLTSSSFIGGALALVLACGLFFSSSSKNVNFIGVRVERRVLLQWHKLYG